MVQASTFVLAAFAIAPVLSAPLNVGPADRSYSRRSIDNVDALESREPFKLGGFLKKAVNVAKKVGKVAIPAARLLLRDEDGNVYVREISFDELAERDFSDMSELEARSFFKKFFKKVGGVAGKAVGIAGKVAGVASKVGGLGLRELEDGSDLIDARDYVDIDELLERDEIDELDARDPKFRLGNILKKVGGVAGKVAGVAGKVAGVAGRLGFRELEDGSVLIDARDFIDIDDLLEEREFVFTDIDELDAREPKFRLGNVLKKVGHVAGKAAGIAGKVAHVAGGLGLREEGESTMEVEAREFEIDELD